MPTLPFKRALPGALVLSLAAHGVAAAFAFKAWHDTKPPATLGRQKGSLQVAFRRDAPPAAKPTAPAPGRNAVAPTPRKLKPRSERPAATPKPPPAAVAAALPTPAVPTPAHAKPGARFASLFAPIVQSPMGQAGWSTRRSLPITAALPAAAAAEQSLAALRAALATRFAGLAEQLRATQAQIACDLVIDIEQRIGQLECEDTAQLSLAWGHLQGPLVAGLVSATAERLCLRLSGAQVLDTGCQSPNP